MSADEFDPIIERLFNRAPRLDDSALFEAKVAARLQSTSRVRTFTLGAAGLIGGLVAVNEIIGVRFAFGPGRIQVSSAAETQSLASAVRDNGAALHGVLDGLGISGLGMSSITQVQGFWFAAAVVLGLLTVGAVKLYQQV